MNGQQEGMTAQVEEAICPNAETTSVPEEKICCTRCASEIRDVGAVCPVCEFAWHEARKQKIVTSFHIYCICLVINLILGIITPFVQGNVLLSVVFSLLTIPISVVGLVFSMMFLYQCWSLIPKKNRRAWPGQHVGFLFVPLYNLYWVFPAYYGLIKRQNALLPEEKRGNDKIVLTFLILPYAFCLLLFLFISIIAIAGIVNPGSVSALPRYNAVQIVLMTVFSVLMAVYGFLAYLQLKKGACSLFELPAEEKKKIMMSVPGAPGAKKTALWPVWTFGGCFTLLLLLMLLSIVFWAFFASQGKTDRVQYFRNLKQIGVALKMYSEDYGGQYPPYSGEKGLELLARENYLPKGEKMFVRPNAAKSSMAKVSAYIYLGGMNSKVPPDTILAVCRTSHDVGKDTRFHVLFADGSVPEVILPGKVGYAELFQKWGILDDRNGFTGKGNKLPPETRDYILQLLDTEQAEKPVSLRK